MLEGSGIDFTSRFIIAAMAVGIGLVILVGVMMVLKRRNSSLFVRGGKSRDPRLMIVDAAAIDAKRRLVLVRRDNVEHLVMIGGPTDIVIETGIGQRSHAVGALPEPTIAGFAPSPAPTDQRPAQSDEKLLVGEMKAKPLTPALLAADAKDILEAARQRVLVREPQPARPPVEPAPKAAEKPVSPIRDTLAHEFEQILEAEMVANGISLDDAPPPSAPTITPPVPGPPQTRPGDTPLEKEMMRLMGEINADRKS